MKIGNFVYVQNKYYVGKIININDDSTVEVKYLINISLSHTEILDINKIVNIHLSKQTRIYNFSQEFGWRTGRIIDYEFMDDGSVEYEIKFSGGKHQEWLKEKELEVRCLSKLNDPTDVLAYSYGESQFLHDARYKILNWMTSLRASVKGMTVFQVHQ